MYYYQCPTCNLVNTDNEQRDELLCPECDTPLGEMSSRALDDYAALALPEGVAAPAAPQPPREATLVTSMRNVLAEVDLPDDKRAELLAAAERSAAVLVVPPTDG